MGKLSLGETVQMDYCIIEETIAVLKSQYEIGTMTAKIIMSRP